LAAVDWLVMLRQQEDGSLEGAAYDVATGRVTSWTALGRGEMAAALLPANLALGEPPRAAMPADHRDTPAAPARRWYRTGWGMGLLIGGAAAVAGTVLAVAMRSDDPRTYTVNRWCFGSSCAP